MSDNDFDFVPPDPPPEPPAKVWTMGDAYREGLLGYPPANRDEPMQAEFLNAEQLKTHGHKVGYVAVDHG